ncbi:MAG: hypothetical protein AAF657_07670 [Acidobacteriota bacterium]
MKQVLRITIASALLLGLAPAAWASYYPEYRQMKKVKYLAHELYEGADHLYEKSSYYSRRGDRYERRAARDLHDLAKAAHHFYDQVDRYYRQPRHTEKDFRRLIYAYHEAVDGFRYLEAYDHYRRDFRCLIETMDKLVHYYGGYGAYDRHGGYGNYDRHDDYKYRKGDRYKNQRYYPTKGEKFLYLLHHVLADD